MRTAGGDSEFLFRGKRLACAIRAKYANAVFILLLPPTMAELRRRMAGRPGTPAKEIRRRLRLARTEARTMRWYDYLVINDRVPRAAGEIETIVKAERSRLVRRRSVLQTFSRGGSR